MKADNPGWGACRRRILHFNTTAHPSGEWIAQQLREAFPLRFLPIRRVRHDSKFSGEVEAFLKDSGLKAARTGMRCPWQNGVAERWVESIRREMLDHVIPLNEAHLDRLSQEYIRYYHEDRTHIALHNEIPGVREIEPPPFPASRVLAVPRVGGLHHRYLWSAAA